MNLFVSAKLTVLLSVLLSFIMIHPVYAQDSEIPDWIKNNASWWGDDLITDDDFTNALGYLISNGIIVVPPTSISCLDSDLIPDWIKNTAVWWGEDLISEEDFLNALQYLVSNGILTLSNDIVGETIERNGRMLGIDTNETTNVNYVTALEETKGAGAEFVALAIQWDMLETSPGIYDPTMLELINWFYPTYDTSVILGINPIDTNNLRVPSDLKDTAFDDPGMINRFNSLMDFVFENTQDVNIIGVNIGNEIDVTLNPDRWDEYEIFYDQVTNHIKSTDRGSKIPVGTKVTLHGLIEHTEQVKALNANSDVIMLTYYPLNDNFTFKDPSVITDSFQDAVRNSDGKSIYFLELGYSSGDLVSSSEVKQSEFISKVFKSWDACINEIPLINFTWLHDKDEKDIETYLSYYGLPDARFAEYLQTLGLKYNDGTAKQAWETLIKETKLRDW